MVRDRSVGSTKFANKGKFKNNAQGAQQAICLAQMAQPPRGGQANQLAVRALKVGGMAQPGIWWVAS